MNYSLFDIDMLAAHFLGVADKYENGEITYEDLDNMLIDSYDVSLDSFGRIAGKLAEFTIPAKTAFGGIARGFVEKNAPVFILKIKEEK